MDARYRLQLVTLLQQYWNTVTEMNASDARVLFDEFIVSCVNPEYAEKFKHDFESRKPLGYRYFKRSLTIDTLEAFMKACKIRLALPVTIWATWESYEEPLGYKLTGNANTLNKIFFYEGDAIAKVSQGKTVFFLFMSGHTNIVSTFMNSS